MDPRIELQPDNTVIVLGAGAMSMMTKNNHPAPQPTTFRSLEKTLLQNPADINSMFQSGQLQEILGCATSEEDTRKVNSNNTGLLDRLLELQRNGALLAYMYPDIFIDQALGQDSLSSGHVDQWVDHSKGIMHLYGVCSDVESMQWLKEKEHPTLSDAIVNVFRNKSCVCVGFGTDMDAQSDLQSFLNQLPADRMQSILIPSETSLKTVCGLPVPVRDSQYDSIYPIGDISKAIGNMIEHDSNDDLGRPLSLLMASKTDYTKAVSLLSTLPGNTFTIMNSMECSGLSFHVMTMYISREKFQEFWYNLMQRKTLESLVNYTVLAVVINYFTFIWLGGGKLTKLSAATTLTLGELMCSSTNVMPEVTTTSLPQTTQPTNMTTFGVMSILNSKNHRTHQPRYTIKKQKMHDLGKNSPSIFKRRQSLPHHLTVPTVPTNNVTQQKNELKHSNLQTSSRQQFLLSRYFMNRKNDPCNNPPPAMKPKLNTLRQLLQEEKKEFAKPNSACMKHLSNWIKERRRNLFVDDSQEWSSHIRKDLKKKITKWRKIKEIRLRKEEDEARRQERVRRTSLDSNASSTTSDIIRSHMSTTGIVNGPIQSPLLTTVNPYVLPHATNFALQASMMYQPSYLSSYPLVTTLPVPYLLPNTSNLVLVSSGSLGFSSTPTAATATSTTKNTSTVSLSVPPPVSLMNASRVPIGSKRKHSNAGKSYSEISSLLLKKETNTYTQSSPKQSARMVASPASLSDEKSDVEEESNLEQMSCDSSENEENQLPLWKFLLELLLSNSYSHLIDWSRIHSLEFEVKQPKEIAKLWSVYKADTSLDYNRYKKVLEYYCTKSQPILNSVSGRADGYRFSSSMLYYINNRYSQLQRSDLSVLNSSNLERSRELCGSQEVLVVD